MFYIRPNINYKKTNNYMSNKTKMLVVSMVYFLSIGSSIFASFPVKMGDTHSKITIKTLKNNDSAAGIHSMFKSGKNLNKTTTPVAPVGDGDDLIITLLLWFFLWPLAAHRWYRQKPVGWNILFILTLGFIYE